jgi:hypothetical protein
MELLLAATSANPRLFGEYAANWVAQRLTKTGQPLRPTTRVSYEQVLRVGLAPFDDVALGKISPS